jgi:hypothetical protein
MIIQRLDTLPRMFTLRIIIAHEYASRPDEKARDATPAQ